MEIPEQTQGRGRFWQRAIVIAWVLLGAFAIRFLPLAVWLKQFGDYIVSLGWIAPFAYVGGYLLCCIFLLPSIAFSMGVGPVFGYWKALVLTIIAANFSATVVFFLARTVLRARVERWSRNKPRFKTLDEAIERNGLAVVALIRLSPFFPFTFANYLLALTRLPYWKFALGTFLGSVPLNAAFLYISCEALKAVDDASQKEVDALKLGVRIAGIAVTFVGLVVISRVVMRALKNAGAPMATDNTNTPAID